MRSQIAVLFILSLVLVPSFAAIPAHAQQPPPVPHAFYGTVEMNGQPAPVGTRIEARGAGVLTGIQGNPLVVTVAGRYGGRTFSESKLLVQGDVQDGTPLEFYVRGMKAEVAVPGGSWQTSYPFASGLITELNLRLRFHSVYLPVVMR